MDFRTEWWSKVLVLLMIGIAAMIFPWMMPEVWTAKSTLGYGAYIVGYPLLLISLATIPVFIICWVSKIMPDLDYSIWLAFGIMLYQLIVFLI